MGILVMVFVVTIAIHHVISDTENVSINTSDDVPTTTEEDLIAIAKRFEVDEYEEAGDIIPMMFTRGKTPARIRWGNSDYTRREQKQIIEAHNAYRKGVSPSSSDMNEILWSPTLAEQAQTWSDGCYYEHPDKRRYPRYNGVGQNLYIKWLDKGGRNPPPVTDPVDKWYDEVRDYDYNSKSCAPGAVCGHYTQVVWAKTTEVGCGITFCPLARSLTRTFQNAWLVTCNYSPAGNMLGQFPYKSGERCSQCEKGYCMKNLCSKCKPKEKGCVCSMKCKNGGKMNRKKCQCKCADGYYGPACRELCEDKDDRCGANPGWPKFWCGNERFSFVQDNCPALCGQCKKAPGRG